MKTTCTTGLINKELLITHFLSRNNIQTGWIRVVYCIFISSPFLHRLSSLLTKFFRTKVAPVRV